MSEIDLNRVKYKYQKKAKYLYGIDLRKKLTVEDIRNIDVQTLSYLPKQQVMGLLKRASILAKEIQKNDIDFMRDNPEIPTPRIYRNVQKMKIGDEVIRNFNYKWYDFPCDEGMTYNEAQARLKVVRHFINASTSKLDEGKLESQKNKFFEILKTSDYFFKYDDYNTSFFWNIYNRIHESLGSMQAMFGGSKQAMEYLHSVMVANDEGYVGDEYLSRRFKNSSEYRSSFSRKIERPSDIEDTEAMRGYAHEMMERMLQIARGTRASIKVSTVDGYIKEFYNDDIMKEDNEYGDEQNPFDVGTNTGSNGGRRSSKRRR